MATPPAPMYDPRMDAPAPAALPFELPPTQDELPYDDGEPMETPKHRQQMSLLIETLERRIGRPDVFIGGNMAMYYSVVQARRNDFKAPDFFVVLNAVTDRERKSWVVWEEDGRVPNVVVELLSESTERQDRGRKMQVYAGLGVHEYYLYDPIDERLEGFRLDSATRSYAPIVAEADGRLSCESLGLQLGVAEGTFQGVRGAWLRWQDPDGTILPTGAEDAEREKARAEREQARAERLAARLRALGVDPDEG